MFGNSNCLENPHQTNGYFFQLPCSDKSWRKHVTVEWDSPLSWPLAKNCQLSKSVFIWDILIIFLLCASGVKHFPYDCISSRSVSSTFWRLAKAICHTSWCSEILRRILLHVVLPNVLFLLKNVMHCFYVALGNFIFSYTSIPELQIIIM
jgi:hypothetical protein